MMAAPTRSPWGHVDAAYPLPLADCWRVHTSSHGGTKLSRAVNARIPASLRNPGGWYEEDCESSIPDAFIPELFAHTLCNGREYTAYSAIGIGAMIDWTLRVWISPSRLIAAGISPSPLNRVASLYPDEQAALDSIA